MQLSCQHAALHPMCRRTSPPHAAASMQLSAPRGSLACGGRVPLLLLALASARSHALARPPTPLPTANTRSGREAAGVAGGACQAAHRPAVGGRQHHPHQLRGQDVTDMAAGACAGVWGRAGARAWEAAGAGILGRPSSRAAARHAARLREHNHARTDERTCKHSHTQLHGLACARTGLQAGTRKCMAVKGSNNACVPNAHAG